MLCAVLALDRLLEHIGLAVEPFALCRLQEGYRFRMAASGEVFVHFALRGRGAVRRGSSELPLAPASLVVVPAGPRHTIEPAGAVEHEIDDGSAVCHRLPSGIAELVGGDGGEDLLVACGRVRATYGDTIGLFDRLDAPLAVDFSDDARVAQLFDTLLAEQRGGAPAAVRMSELLMHQILILLFRRLCAGGDCALPWLSALEHPGLARAVDAILGDPAAPHSLDSLAERAGMSRSVFSQQFTAAFGQSAAELVRETRLRQAARLLQTTDLSIKEIAGKVGFASRSHFSRAFKKHFDRDPARFRGAP